MFTRAYIRVGRARIPGRVFRALIARRYKVEKVSSRRTHGYLQEFSVSQSTRSRNERSKKKTSLEDTEDPSESSCSCLNSSKFRDEPGFQAFV